VINNWNYAALIDVFNKEGRSPCLARQVRTAGELRTAIDDCQTFDSLCFIEVFVDKDDCNKNLLKWGSYVGATNSEPSLTF
jgi:indolepyruvate decarboxylase